MMRLFIACPLPEPVREGLGKIISDLRQEGDQIKWVATNNIHLTMRFLGNTDETIVPAIKNRMHGLFSGFEPVESTINRIGAFPNLRRPRVIWAGLAHNTEPLSALAANIELAMQDLGFEAESKGFRAHLTLGRLKHGRGSESLIARLSEFELVPLPVRFDRLVLFKSTLTPRGPIYQPLYEVTPGE
jgi:2'-5' RNA ligase